MGPETNSNCFISDCFDRENKHEIAFFDPNNISFSFTFALLIWGNLFGVFSGYNRYSFGIGIGRYIGLTDKENALSVSVSVSADTVFYIGSFTDTAQPYFEWCKYYISPKDFNIAISKAPK